MTDFYEVLGVARTATSKEIRSKFHELALKWHPDKNSAPDAKEKFQKIGLAYETLSDPEARLLYDKSLGFTTDFNFAQYNSNYTHQKPSQAADFSEESDAGYSEFSDTNWYAESDEYIIFAFVSQAQKANSNEMPKRWWQQFLKEISYCLRHPQFDVTNKLIYAIDRLFMSEHVTITELADTLLCDHRNRSLLCFYPEILDNLSNPLLVKLLEVASDKVFFEILSTMNKDKCNQVLTLVSNHTLLSKINSSAHDNKPSIDNLRWVISFLTPERSQEIMREVSSDMLIKMLGSAKWLVQDIDAPEFIHIFNSLDSQKLNILIQDYANRAKPKQYLFKYLVQYIEASRLPEVIQALSSEKLNTLMTDTEWLNSLSDRKEILQQLVKNTQQSKINQFKEEIRKIQEEDIGSISKKFS